jgi:hypothetical protein
MEPKDITSVFERHSSQYCAIALSGAQKEIMGKLGEIASSYVSVETAEKGEIIFLSIDHIAAVKFSEGKTPLPLNIYIPRMR